MKDLFGEDVVDRPKLSKKSIRKQLEEFHYRKSEDQTKKCATCSYCFVIKCGKNYYKCAFVGYSRSASTDIRASNVCDLWKEIPKAGYCSNNLK